MLLHAKLDEAFDRFAAAVQAEVDYNKKSGDTDAAVDPDRRPVGHRGEDARRLVGPARHHRRILQV